MDITTYMNDVPLTKGVLVPNTYLDSLEKDSYLLQALLAEGVMQWDGYNSAKQSAEEE
jgi:hypothetical protein